MLLISTFNGKYVQAWQILSQERQYENENPVKF